MMQTTPEQLDRLINRTEDCNLEFKAALNSFDRSRDLPDYCAALANERGGKLVLGVKEKADKKGAIIGTSAFFGTHNKLSNELLKELGIRVDVEEVVYCGKRVLIFHVPSRPTGSVIRSRGRYNIPMRAGDSLCEMDDHTLKMIMNERESDYSSQIVPELTLDDLDEKAILKFKELWSRNAQRTEYLQYSGEKILDAAELIIEKGITIAALLLFGKGNKLSECLPGAEIIFEWRTNEKQTRYDDRRSWRAAFFSIYDEIWQAVNNRNIKYPFQHGFIQRDIWAFNEKTIREAIFNAVAHRDYSITSRSIFITASPNVLIVESPGGFLPGITPDNLLYKKQWRNRRIAEAFEKADFVERSGQGVNDIFENTIREGKGLPDYHQSDPTSVIVHLPAAVQDPAFVSYLETITNERQISLSFEEIYELEKIRGQKQQVNPEYLRKFKGLELVEKIGRGRGSRYILSHKYYTAIGKTGVHTRLSGVPRETQKQLILEHLKRNGTGTMQEFKDIFPGFSRNLINSLLRDLKNEKKIVCTGKTKGALWQLC